ncbi:MAG: hypothetical protein Q7T16_00810 [Candidatus Burarchaeum sp.]|nr:hypothetical protein [Candidatus Burarchaeum sp.]MDO8339177.1 hypothetical protein [Candidatus Burarchaeum sp.]
MVNVTLAVPEDVYRLMKRRKEVNWSEVARQAIRSYAANLEVMDRLAKGSKMTGKDALELGRKINRGLAARYRKGFE